MQCLDLKVNRKALNVFVGIVAWLGVCLFLGFSSIGTMLDGWLASVAGWTAVWGGIMLVHFFIIERKHSDFSSVLAPFGKSGTPLIRWQAMVAFFAGLAMCWAFSYGSLFQGTFAVMLGDVDLSWLGGMATSALVYFVLTKVTDTVTEQSPLLEQAM